MQPLEIFQILYSGHACEAKRVNLPNLLLEPASHDDPTSEQTTYIPLNRCCLHALTCCFLVITRSPVRSLCCQLYVRYFPHFFIHFKRNQLHFHYTDNHPGHKGNETIYCQKTRKNRLSSRMCFTNASGERGNQRIQHCKTNHASR